MDVLYLSHCVPNPPDKGERIRAFHEVRHLALKCRVHLACFARSRSEAAAAEELSGQCVSVHAEPLPAIALPRAACKFAFGACLTTSFYSSRRMQQHVRRLAARFPLAATVSYSSAVAPYAPEGVPLLLDLVDVDSEKWLQYANMRRPRWAYALEGRRLRRLEAFFSARAKCVFLSTVQEEELLRSLAPQAVTRCMENGVDFEHFDPMRFPELSDLRNRRFVVFVGAMDYYPNVDAACWFANEVYPELRRSHPEIEFFVVGRNPKKAVSSLTRQQGITVTGAVPDVRPYLASALALAAPLRIARGIQNKVLEALAMAKPVVASPAVCDTFGGDPPLGVVRCESVRDYVDAVSRTCAGPFLHGPAIRRDACRRFSWSRSMELLSAELQAVTETPKACSMAALSALG